MALDKHDMTKIEATFSRYVKIMSEDFESKLKPLTELVLAQGKKIDALFEMVAKNTEDINMIKIKLSIIEKDVADIKKELKNKVDFDKVKTLEKNILVLKHKIA